MTNQLSFNDKTLTPIIQNNQTWLTSTDLANALGYKDTRSVTKIFNRNDDEFTECMSLVVKLTTNGINNSSREKETRIFSLRGCHLIAMFARIEQAKAFRKWVLDILDKETAQTEPTKPDNTGVDKHGLTRLLMTFENGNLTNTTPVPFTSGIVSFESPEILKEMIRDTMPGYALVNKKELSKAFGL
jgi:prophage antirepressor-like protein